MASPERISENFGERNGKRIRNAGIILTALSFFGAPVLTGPSAGIAAGGEVIRRVSKKKNE